MIRFVFLAVTVLGAVTASPFCARAETKVASRKNWFTPAPILPEEVSAKDSMPCGTVRVTATANGTVGKVEILISTGDPVIDKIATDFVRAHWLGPARKTAVLPVIFQELPQSSPAPSPTSTELTLSSGVAARKTSPTFATPTAAPTDGGQSLPGAEAKNP